MKKDYDKPNVEIRKYRMIDPKIMDGESAVSARDTGNLPANGVQYTLGSMLDDMNS